MNKAQPLIIALLLTQALSVGTNLQAEGLADLSASAEMVVAMGSDGRLPYLLTQNRHGVLAPVGSQLYLRMQADYHHHRGRFHYGGAVDLIGYASSGHDYYGSHVYLQQGYAEVGYGRYFLEFGSHEDGGNFVDPSLSSGNMIWSGNSRPLPGLRFGTRDFVRMIVLAEAVEAKIDCQFSRMVDGSYNDRCYDAYTQANGPLRASAVDGAYLHRKSVFFRSNSRYPFFVTLGIEHAALYGGTIRHRDGDWDDAGGLDGQNHTAEVIYHQTGKWGNAMLGGTGRENDALNQMMAFDMRLDVRSSKWALGIYKQHYVDDLNDKSFERFGDGLWGVELQFKRLDWLRHLVVEYIQTDSQGDNTQAMRKLANGEEPAVEDFASDFYQDQRFGGYAHYGMACGNSMLSSPIWNTDRYPGFHQNVMRGFQLGFEGQLSYELGYRVKVAHIGSQGDPWSIAIGNLTGHPLAKPTDTSLLVEGEYKFDNGLCLSSRLAIDHGDLYGDNYGLFVSARYSFGGK